MRTAGTALIVVLLVRAPAAADQDLSTGSGPAVADITVAPAVPIDGSAAPAAPASITRDDRRRPTVRAIKLAEEFTLDGQLDERVYTENEPFGQFIQVEHLAPGIEGSQITCRARIIHVDGPVVTFQIEATDGVETIAKGLHRRRVIDVDRFRRRVERKAGRRGL